MIGVTILGATGSIGTNTLDVIGRHPDRYRVVALAANRDVERMAKLCRLHRPELAVMAEASAAERLERLLKAEAPEVTVLAGAASLEAVAALPQTQYVVAAIVGAAGLRSSLAAARSGKRLLLANKEALVMSGQIFMDEVRRSAAELLPVDSEHNALFQCLPAERGLGLDAMGVHRLWLTGSGGPFRTWALEDLPRATPQQACKHPNWVMGPKISVDSATMMNKGLEVIEACWLFSTTPERVRVVLHPQSLIHSLVEYADGSFLAQLGSPDMRIPIAHALGWPDRIPSGAPTLDLFEMAQLDFSRPEPQRYPCLGLAAQAMAVGGTAPAVLNAANEAAVEAFLSRRLGFAGIPAVVEETLSTVPIRAADSLDAVLAADSAARDFASEHIARLQRRIFNE
jgi:1-deoxy-D-xylulose-5-phosphate reductoisomerase